MTKAESDAMLEWIARELDRLHDEITLVELDIELLRHGLSARTAQ